jgi:hypothetical protein
LTDAGFSSIVDVDRDDLNARYFANRSDGLRVIGALGRIVCATR